MSFKDRAVVATTREGDSGGEAGDASADDRDFQRQASWGRLRDLVGSAGSHVVVALQWVAVMVYPLCKLDLSYINMVRR